MRRFELDRYLMELLQADTWAAGIKHVLAARQAGRPWLHYRNVRACGTSRRTPLSVGGS